MDIWVIKQNNIFLILFLPWLASRKQSSWTTLTYHKIHLYFRKIYGIHGHICMLTNLTENLRLKSVNVDDSSKRVHDLDPFRPIFYSLTVRRDNLQFEEMFTWIRKERSRSKQEFVVNSLRLCKTSPWVTLLSCSFNFHLFADSLVSTLHFRLSFLLMPLPCVPASSHV